MSLRTEPLAAPPRVPAPVMPLIWEPARILAEPARAKAVDLLLDRDRLPVSYLASYSAVSAQTMTAHLAVLSEAGWVRVERSGRYRFVSLVEEIRGPLAEVVERLGVLAVPRPVSSLIDHRELDRLSLARTCYDHIAGHLGVELLSQLRTREGIIDTDGGFAAGSALDAALAEIFGVHIEIAPGRGRTIGTCLDWSQGRLHGSGLIGRTLLGASLRLGFVEKRTAGRSLQITPLGAQRFESLGIVLDARS